MLKKNILYSALSILFFTCMSVAQSSEGGFSLGSTRVIYPAEKKEATVMVVNSAPGLRFLAQSWVDPYSPDGKSGSGKAPFMVTPPLYLQTTGSNTLHIVRTGPVGANDRESVYWLNVKAIPSAKKTPGQKDGGTIQFSYLMKIKLFYRPQGLSGKPGDAYEKITFSRAGNKLTVNNPTPYYITFNKITVGGREIKDVNAMTPPLGSQSYSIPAGAVGDVVYKTINDYGGLTQEKRVSLQ